MHPGPRGQINGVELAGCGASRTEAGNGGREERGAAQILSSGSPSTGRGSTVAGDPWRRGFGLEQWLNLSSAKWRAPTLCPVADTNRASPTPLLRTAKHVSSSWEPGEGGALSQCTHHKNFDDGLAGQQHPLSGFPEHRRVPGALGAEVHLLWLVSPSVGSVNPTQALPLEGA